MFKKYDKVVIIIFVFSDTDTTLKSVKNNYGTNKNKIQAIDKTCSICMEDVLDGDNNLIILSCGHMLHKSCFRTNYIIHMNNKCPLCRKILNKKDAEIKLKK